MEDWEQVVGNLFTLNKAVGRFHKSDEGALLRVVEAQGADDEFKKLRRSVCD